MAKPPSPSPSPSPSSADSAASTTTTAAPPSALPTAEAIEVLLSPDGYYRYLGIPRPAPDVLGPKYQEVMGPDTTTAADDVVGGSSNGGTIDLDLVKRNYRRLSLRHHPDRRTGDAETFRALNRAKVVLSNPKLRREYDLVGLDLDDDADDHIDHHHHHHHGPADGNVGKSDASAGGGATGRTASRIAPTTVPPGEKAAAAVEEEEEEEAAARRRRSWDIWRARHSRRCSRWS